MDDLDYIKKIAGLNEGKYGYKFDQYKTPFKTDGKKIMDNSGKELCECKNQDLAKELSNILNDMQKMRDAAEKFYTIWR